MLNVKNPKNRDRMKVLIKGLLRKGSIFMGKATTKREHSQLEKNARNIRKAEECVVKGTWRASTTTNESGIMSKGKVIIEGASHGMSLHTSKDTAEGAKKSPLRAWEKRHAADIKVARSELGPLNLDYAEADKAMLNQALRLRKRFG